MVNHLGGMQEYIRKIQANAVGEEAPTQSNQPLEKSEGCLLYTSDPLAE